MPGRDSGGQVGTGLDCVGVTAMEERKGQVRVLGLAIALH